ncbi:MAG: hypothetical protein M3Y80_08935 [Verrucomicrobiota bacterium]|nr:hypothetical protein [Verrucomicrobiota bacterium]
MSFAQQTIVPPGPSDTFGQSSLPLFDPNGMTLAQNESAIEQSRLYRETIPPVSVGVDANGTAVADTESTSSDDDSFGAQQILKSQERQRSFTVTGNASVVYTDNVALTRRGEQDDVFGVVDAGINWAHIVSNNLEANVGFRASIFRYDKAESLDFENLGFGMGLAWAPPGLKGFSLFGRYDFTELLNRDGDQILMDHTLTLGVQKAVALGRSHGFTFGATAMFGLSDPSAAERSQLGAFIGYHLQISRKLETDFLYRPAVHFYTGASRTDFNQILSWTMRYRFNGWAELNATLSYGVNRSDHSVFDYNVLTTGAGIGLIVRF